MTEDCQAIRPLEERLMNAWPALRTMMCDGWVFREAMGYTKRANSACALDARGAFRTTLDQAERFYASFGAPATFRLTPLAGDLPDRILSDRGYRALDETIVMTAPLAETDLPDKSVSIAPNCTSAWENGHANACELDESQRRAHRAILDRIAPLPRAFAMSQDDNGRAVSFGLGTIERGHLAIFDIVTLPDARRRGAAGRIVSTLMAWGAHLGADAAWLSVLGDNANAIPLYGKLGFRELYRYHYRVSAQHEGRNGTSRDNVARSV